MKTYSKFSVLTLLILVLSACTGNATTTPEEASLSNIYTSAALTLSVQGSVIPATMTSMPTTSPTARAFPTSVPVTATLQNVVSYASNSTANGCNDSAYISDVTISDGTVLAPNESFTKTWEFQNTGTCDWNEDYSLIFISGTSMDGETTEIDQDVSTGGTGEISVSLIAPETEGTYTGYWRLAGEDGAAFGQPVYVMIVVSEDAATATFTPISIPTVISTETYTPIPTGSE